MGAVLILFPLRRRQFENQLNEKPFKSELKDCGGFSQNFLVLEVKVDPEIPIRWYHGEKEINTS